MNTADTCQRLGDIALMRMTTLQISEEMLIDVEELG